MVLPGGLGGRGRIPRPPAPTSGEINDSVYCSRPVLQPTASNARRRHLANSGVPAILRGPPFAAPSQMASTGPRPARLPTACGSLPRPQLSYGRPSGVLTTPTGWRRPSGTLSMPVGRLKEERHPRWSCSGDPVSAVPDRPPTQSVPLGMYRCRASSQVGCHPRWTSHVPYLVRP